ncbi:protein phosphatase 1 regulatory subunit 3B [Exaiptasia diaphana]|uniref:CBM21 domain-containing protein n=1 Tax=Exaiptasia diaphana TaxID=2652724 RepID=A0A913XHF1_EXADI|nr:protein phosphatase 1 regulatory subunit 3B [Exaiptasia diaphana]
MSLRRVSSVRAGKTPFSDDDEDGCQSILRRHSSLPAKRKNVHFADSFGKPLVSAYSEEEYNIHVSLAQVKKEMQKAKKSLRMCFQQPVSLDGFRERLEHDYVCLENAVIQSENSLIGTVKVKNIAYHKEVIVRYTLDSWNSHTDVGATYVLDSYDGNSDRFSFAVTLPEYFLAAGGNLELAICYKTDGQEYWDNNGGINYRVECAVNESEYRSCALSNGF